MPAKDKIKTYQLEKSILELRGHGKSTAEIATIVSDGLGDKDTISQRTIARFLAVERKKRKVVADVILEDYINLTLPSDLKILDELSETFLGLFRYNTGALNQTLKLLQAKTVDLNAFRKLKIELALNESISIDEPSVKLGMQAADRLHAILNTKFRFIGVGDRDDDLIPPKDAAEREQLEEIAKELAERKRRQIHEQTGT